MSNRPLRIGITGGIGTGKSTVARVFELLKVPVYNADERARWLMENDQQLSRKIISSFGRESFLDGRLNRQYLAAKVFSNEVFVKELNALVHPAVAEDFDKWCNQPGAAYVLKEAALLFETGSYRELDATILVRCPMELRIERIKKRDPLRSIGQIENIIGKQMNVKEAEGLADYIIDNDESAMIIPQVLELHRSLCRETGSSR